MKRLSAIEPITVCCAADQASGIETIDEPGKRDGLAEVF